VIDINTATAQECADWLAEQDGWNQEPPQVDGMGDQREYWWQWTISSAHGGRTYAYSPPYPLTLDAAAGALKRPWRLVRVDLNHDGRTMATIYNGAECKWNNIEGPDELTARYRAAVAARLDGMEGRG
jgi:hypothetical protein